MLETDVAYSFWRVFIGFMVTDKHFVYFYYEENFYVIAKYYPYPDLIG